MLWCLVVSFSHRHWSQKEFGSEAELILFPAFLVLLISELVSPRSHGRLCGGLPLLTNPPSELSISHCLGGGRVLLYQ